LLELGCNGKKEDAYRALPLFEAGPDDSFVVAGGIEHQTEAPEDAVVIDVFSPCREGHRP